MSVFTNPAGSALEQSEAYVRAVLGLVGDQDPASVLHNTTTALRQILDVLPAEVLTVPESPGKWSMSFNDGDWSLFIDVTDENIEPHENANPVITLRMRYDAWRSSTGP